MLCDDNKSVWYVKCYGGVQGASARNHAQNGRQLTREQGSEEDGKTIRQEKLAEERESDEFDPDGALVGSLFAGYLHSEDSVFVFNLREFRAYPVQVKWLSRSSKRSLNTFWSAHTQTTRQVPILISVPILLSAPILKSPHSSEDLHFIQGSHSNKWSHSNQSPYSNKHPHSNKGPHFNKHLYSNKRNYCNKRPYSNNRPYSSKGPHSNKWSHSSKGPISMSDPIPMRAQ